MAERFFSREPSITECWRGIVLFGRNVASYKFALAKSLMALKPQAGQLVKLEELAPVFAAQIVDHLKGADKQATSPSSGFLDACRQYIREEITEDQLHSKTVQSGL